MKKQLLEKITFRTPEIKDVSAMMNYINRISAEETFINMQGRQLTLEEEKVHVIDLLEKIKKGDALAIHAWHGNELVGIADLSRGKDASSHVANMGITVKKEYRGKGLGRELMSRLLANAKKMDGLSIITLGVFAENTIAVHLYESLGFSQYGRLAGGIKRKGKFSDHLFYYINLR